MLFARPARLDLLTALDAARLLGLSATRVRVLARTGQLPTAATTTRGARLFRREDVERLAAARAGRPGCQHTVQFYLGDDYLAAVVGAFIAGGLRAGAPAVVIATEAHREALQRHLAREAPQVEGAIAAGRLVFLDARATLATFMRDGAPDEARFRRHVGGVIERTRAGSARGPLRAFGEMVDLLWQDGDRQAALDLEELWNRLAGALPFSLLCAYALEGFPEGHDGVPFEAICRSHTRVFPAESAGPELDTDARRRAIACLQQRAGALAREVRTLRQQNDLRSAALRQEAPPGARAATSRAAKDPAALGPRGTRRILVIDDNEAAAELLAELLAECGHVAEVACSGTAALELAERFAPDLALVDTELPDMSGVEVASCLRERHDAIQLIAQTGYRDGGRRAATDFDAYLVKPVHIEEILACLAMS